jgi:hypothetical protein
MSAAIGTVVRDGDDLLWRLSAGMHTGVYRTPAAEVADLLAGGSAVLYEDDGWPVGDLGTSASLRILIGQLREAGVFLVEPGPFPVEDPTFMVPRAQVRAYYDRGDGPAPVLSVGGA